MARYIEFKEPNECDLRVCTEDIVLLYRRDTEVRVHYKYHNDPVVLTFLTNSFAENVYKTLHEEIIPNN